MRNRGRTLVLVVGAALVMMLCGCGDRPYRPTVAPSDPSPTDPAPTDLPPTDLPPTDPSPTDRVPTDPSPTDPSPTDPAPPDPAPTDPSPTDPAPTDQPPPDPPAPTTADVKGRVLDWYENKELTGAEVSLKSDPAAAHTVTVDGDYKLTVDVGTATFLYACTGYLPFELVGLAVAAPVTAAPPVHLIKDSSTAEYYMSAAENMAASEAPGDAVAAVWRSADRGMPILGRARLALALTAGKPPEMVAAVARLPGLRDYGRLDRSGRSLLLEAAGEVSEAVGRAARLPGDRSAWSRMPRGIQADLLVMAYLGERVDERSRVKFLELARKQVPDELASLVEKRVPAIREVWNPR